MHRDAPDTTIVFMCYAVGCLVVTPFVLVHRGASFLATPHPRLQVSWAMAGFLYFGSLFVAFRTIPLVDGILLRSAAPIWVPLLMWLIWKQRIPGRSWWGIGAGFVGVALVLHPGYQAWAIGYPVALGSGVAYALNNIAARHINKAGEPVLRTLFYTFLVPTVLMAVPAVLFWQPVAAATWPLLIGIGLGTVAIVTCFVAGLSHTPAYVLAPFGYAAVVFAAMLDWAAFGRVPNALTIAGILVVTASCILIVRLGRVPIEH